MRDRESTKASVVLDLKPGAHFTRADAQSIVSLVSHGVEGLDPENVTVLDTEGRLLSSNHGFEADVTGQLEYRRRLEADLAAKAETMLSQLLGPGRAVVRVTADIDFTETEREETTYDPDGKVKLSEEVTSEQTTGMQASAAGAAGTASNVGGGAGGGSRNPVTTKIESNKTEYANAEVRDRVREAPAKSVVSPSRRSSACPTPRRTPRTPRRLPPLRPATTRRRSKASSSRPLASMHSAVTRSKFWTPRCSAPLNSWPRPQDLRGRSTRNCCEPSRWGWPPSWPCSWGQC